MTTLTQRQILLIPRGQIRYALFRQRSGNPEQKHLDITEHYMSRLAQYGLKIAEFSEVWDLSETNPLDIVSGHVVHQMKEDRKSLFNPDGNLK